ncbi:hypothetical protein EVAR_48177_1 [Eumeta japonica]|uniref:Uncharacterized protein n=1 Tax=Eumeta variegata TaxID=151549 RepID=A0A4C1XSA7_EUMVA|nr:hypothetical protein EVAR_48177_1 [Eumeta japonica]
MRSNTEMRIERGSGIESRARIRIYLDRDRVLNQKRNPDLNPSSARVVSMERTCIAERIRTLNLLRARQIGIENKPELEPRRNSDRNHD